MEAISTALVMKRPLIHLVKSICTKQTYARLHSQFCYYPQEPYQKMSTLNVVSHEFRASYVFY